MDYIELLMFRFNGWVYSRTAFRSWKNQVASACTAAAIQPKLLYIILSIQLRTFWQTPTCF